MKTTKLLAITILLITVSSCLTGRAGAASKPNIILIITDDQGYGPVGRHGHPC